MISRFNKIVLSAAFISPLLLSAPAMANMAPLKVDPTAVSQLTNSVQQTLTAYDHLRSGNKVEAQRVLTTALRQIESAVAKDSSLGVAQVKATTLHSDLKRIQSKLNTSASQEVRTELRRVLQNAGIQTTA